MGQNGRGRGYPGGAAGPYFEGMEPLVSVVIPCYAQAHFLAEAVDSVFRQTHAALELVVVNDGSPDTAAMTALLAPVLGRIVYVTQENRGLAGARNSGLGRCRGEYVIFLDADDRLLPNAAADGAAALAARPELGLVWGLRHVIDASGTPTRQDVGRIGTGEDYVHLLQTNIVGPPVGVMWRRAALNAIGGFSPWIRCAEDYDAYLRIAREHDISCHGATVGEYRASARRQYVGQRQADVCWHPRGARWSGRVGRAGRQASGGR